MRTETEQNIISTIKNIIKEHGYRIVLETIAEVSSEIENDEFLLNESIQCLLNNTNVE